MLDTVSWYNFKTKEYDDLPVSASLTFTKEQAAQYISQAPAAQNLFRLLHEDMGKSVNGAMLHVLQVMAGVNEAQP